MDAIISLRIEARRASIVYSTRQLSVAISELTRLPQFAGSGMGLSAAKLPNPGQPFEVLRTGPYPEPLLTYWG